VIDVAELYRSPEASAYSDINWGGIIAFFVGLAAGWSVAHGLVPALQGPISTGLLGGADLSWLIGMVVAAAVYLIRGHVKPERPGPTTATHDGGAIARDNDDRDSTDAGLKSPCTGPPKR
jgi:cytosine/uracil/thiamine/allantoin permease